MRSRASRSLQSVLRRRFSCGVSADVLLGLRAIATILSVVEFAKDAIAFGNPCFSELPADRVQVRMAEKIGIAIAAGLPDRPVPGGDGEVGAGETRAFGPQHGVGAFLIAEAGSRFDAVDTIAPVTNTEPQISLLHQEGDIGLDIPVARAPAELGAGGNHPSALASKRRRRQHLFERGARFLLGMAIDQVIESEVSPNITAISHGPGHMTEVGLKRMQASAVAFADEAS